jgi:hypothetical protein
MLRFLAAAALVVAVPLAVAGAAEPAPRKSEKAKKICEVDATIGTRLGATRRCRTKAERDAHKQEAREVVDRIQMMKPTMCPPNC